MKTRLVLVGTDDEVGEAFRLRMIHGFTPSKIARKLKVSKERARELLIAASYWGKGFKDRKP